MSNKGKKSIIPHLFDTINGTTIQPFINDETPFQNIIYDIGKYFIRQKWMFYENYLTIIHTLKTKIEEENDEKFCSIIVEIRQERKSNNSIEYVEYVIDGDGECATYMSLFEYKYACYEYDKHFQHQKSILNTLDYDYDIFKEHLIALNNKK